MKIPFDIKYRPQIESGEYKVETRDGRPVKIISFEMTDTNDCPIAAQFRLCAGTPVVCLFDKEGHYKGEGEFDYDLFLITPEPELSEFEKAVKDLCWKVGMGEVVYKDDIIKKIAAELLELARKELIVEQLASDPRKTDLYKLGKFEALKDLPRWKKADRDWDAGTIDFAVFHKNDGGDHEDWFSVEVTNRLYKGEYYIELSDLEKLPKEE